MKKGDSVPHAMENKTGYLRQQDANGMWARFEAKQRRARFVRMSILLSLMLLTIIVVVVGIAIGRLHQKDANVTYVGDIPVIQDFLPEDAAGRPGIKRKIEYIVIHETDNFKEGADAQAHNTFIHEDGQIHEHSWHYTVDEHEIYHHLPDDEAAFHAGDHLVQDGGNLNGIGVEMCVNADGDYEQTLRNTMQLTAALLHAYGLTVEDVRKHQDFSGKICPATLIGENRWQEFLDGVQAAYDAADENA